MVSLTADVASGVVRWVPGRSLTKQSQEAKVEEDHSQEECEVTKDSGQSCAGQAHWYCF